QRSVLVCPYEQVEGVERLIPSVVWLNALDYLQGRCWNSTGFSQMRRGPIRFGETRLIWHERERDPSLLSIGQGLSGQHGKLPRDVVQTGPQVGDKIPDYAREGRRRLGCDDTFDTYNIPL